MMTFEGAQFLGPQNIIEKLQGLGQVKHEPKNRDVQPGVAPNTILIQVSGTVNIGGPNPVAFIETIQLNATAPGQYYVHNTMFRLMYALWVVRIIFGGIFAVRIYNISVAGKLCFVFII